jgi:hypothetical protein
VKLIHNHGHVVGFEHARTWHDIDGRPHVVPRCYHLSMTLFKLAEWREGCPGGIVHGERHRNEHGRWRAGQGLRPLEEEWADDEAS